jgi:hypothetical protein
VQVHYDEGVAIRIGPEPCVAARKGRGEASVGECVGQPLSRDSVIIPGADAVKRVEGNTAWRVVASALPTRRGRRPWHVQKLLEREPGDPASGRLGCATPVRIGKARSRSR